MSADIVAQTSRIAAILLAKSAVAAAPLREMVQHAEHLQATGRIGKAVAAFSEQGQPPLKEVVQRLRDEGYREILILPLVIPMEPAFTSWIARALQRWHAEIGGDWPIFRIGAGIAACAQTPALLHTMLDTALAAPVITTKPEVREEGSIVAERRHRVLICLGSACNQAGASLLWGHLRNRQADMKLADLGGGMASAKTSCLGPCALAPVVQIYPEGTVYGGVDEDGIDRIIQRHLLDGEIVEELEYLPRPGKQRLRRAAANGDALP